MVRPEVADLVTFRQINLLDPEWPIRGPFDVIFCRNVLIYFDHETHDRLMRRMSRYLASNGSLFIGHSESLSRLTDTYTRVGKTVYQRADAAASQRQDEDPSAGYTGGLSARGSNTEAHGDVTLRSDPGTGLKSRTGTGGSYTQTSGPSGISQRATSASATGMNQPKVDECSRTSIIVGGVAASDKPSEIDTVLGSCIAACLYDDDAHIGGMNHFALPGGDNNSRAAASYGVHAMELLINSIMQLGGDRRRLKAKVFGGATVLNSASGGSIGNRNAEFIRDFLSTESIPLEAVNRCGDCGMKLRFETHTGRARVKLLSRDDAVAADQRSQESPPEVTHETPGDVTLF
jgi:chemotaxis receptor (MCP) glutamine deamidase CheD